MIDNWSWGAARPRNAARSSSVPRGMIVAAATLAILALFPAVVFGSPVDTDGILRELDRQGSFMDTDFSAEYTVVSERPGEDRSITRVRSFRRDAERKMTMVILEPRIRRGEGYLQIGDTAWSYDPESREFAVFSLRENFGESDARHSDFAEMTISANYEVTSVEQGTLGRFDVHILDLSATNDTMTFPRIRLWVRQDTTVVLQEQNYSLSDRLMRTVLYPNYARAGDRVFPSKILIIDNLNDGERTEITVREIGFSRIDDAVFTRGYLERIGR